MFHLNSVICINIEVCIISEYKYRYFDLIYTIKMGKITIYVVKHVFNIFVALQKEYIILKNFLNACGDK